MIKACGHRLVVKPYRQEEVDEVIRSAKKAGFEIVNSNKEREDKSVDKGVVLFIGPTAWKDFGGTPWCKVGDEIFFARHAGKFIEDPETEEQVCILNDEDVVAIVKEA